MSDRGSSADEAYRRLRESLADLSLPAHERLTEIALAERLGMSRTPVREAIRRLQADGLVEPAGRGVAPAVLRADEVQDLYAVRASLEALAGELAAGRQAAGQLAPADLERLDRAVAAFEAAADRGDATAMARANLALHGLVADLAGNAFLAETLRRIHDRIAISSISNLSDPAWLVTVRADHRSLAAAVRAGDGTRAGGVLRRHVLEAAAVHDRRRARG